MRAWVVMLGGLGVWAVHFLGVYGLASLADLSPNPAWRWTAIGMVFSLVCLVSLWPLFAVARRRSSSGLVGSIGQAGALLAAIAVVWQSLPLVVSV